MGSEDENPTTLQPEEILWVREQRRQHAHEQWLRGQIKILWPWIVGVVGALVAVASWVKDHVRL